MREGTAPFARWFLDFESTPEQKEIRKSIRTFAENEIRPHVLTWDEAQHFPAELLPKLAELGLMGVTFRPNTVARGWGTPNTSSSSKSSPESTDPWR